MNKIVFTATILFLLAYPSLAQLTFESQPFSNAKEKALHAEKPFLAYFSGDWCVNCKVMEETTFKSEGVAMAVANRYDTYKIDFDDSHSEDWKEAFEICCLPSFLIFDKDAQLLNKIEQPLTSTNLIKLLSNPTEFDPELERKNYLNNQQSEVVALSTSITEEEPVVIETNESVKEKPEHLRIVITKAGSDFDYSKLPKEEIEERTSISDRKVNIAPEITAQVKNDYEKPKKSTTNYQVQIGYFSTFENAMKMVKRSEKIYDFPISISEEFKDKKTYYRVYLGEFANYKAAKSEYDKIKMAGRRASIRKVNL